MSRFWVPIFVLLGLVIVGVTVALVYFVEQGPVAQTKALVVAAPAAAVASPAAEKWELSSWASGNSTFINAPGYMVEVSGGAMGRTSGNGTVTISTRGRVVKQGSSIAEAKVTSTLYIMINDRGDISVGEPKGELTAEDKGLRVGAQPLKISEQSTDAEGRHVVTITMVGTVSYQGQTKDTKAAITATATDIIAHPPPAPFPPFPTPPVVPTGMGNGWQIMVQDGGNHGRAHLPLNGTPLKLNDEFDVGVEGYSTDGTTAVVVITQHTYVTDAAGNKIAENSARITYQALVNYLGEIHFDTPSGSAGGSSYGVDVHIDSPQVSTQTTDGMGRHVVGVTFEAHAAYQGIQSGVVQRAEFELIATPTTVTPAVAPAATTSAGP